MKKVQFVSIIVCLFATLFVVNGANAQLELLGQGTSTHGTYNLIYDTDLDITWYDYSNTRVNNDWQDHMDWADALSVAFGSNTYNDWRLPIMFDESCQNYNCTNSDMGHLYYTDLGNTAGIGGFTNQGDFQNLQDNYYWFGTEYASDTDQAWSFDFNVGLQRSQNKPGELVAIAVMSGRAIVPEPASMILFLSGGATLVGRYWRRRVGQNHNRKLN